MHSMNDKNEDKHLFTTTKQLVSLWICISAYGTININICLEFAASNQKTVF